MPAFDEDEGADAYRRIVARLDARYRWYETANFAPPGPEVPPQPRLLLGARPTTSASASARSARPPGGGGAHAGVAAYVAALAGGDAPPRTLELLDGDDVRRERWMLGLRLADGLDPARPGPRTAPRPSTASPAPGC